MTLVVIGDNVDASVAVIVRVGGVFFFAMLTAFYARRTTICFVVSELSLFEYLHARITCGMLDAGHFHKYATVCIVDSS